MISIENNSDLLSFLERVDSFHDAIIRHCILLARGHVDSQRCMHQDLGPFDAMVLVQTQFADLPGVEIAFDGVTRFSIGQPADLEPQGIVQGDEIRFSFAGSLEPIPDVIAAGMRYRLLDASCLGPEARCSEPPGTGQVSE